MAQETETREVVDVGKQILDLPDDANILVQHDKKRRATDIRPKNPVTFKMNAADLKALVRQRDELKSAIERFIDKGTWENASLNYATVIDDDEFGRLRSAVEEAERG